MKNHNNFIRNTLSNFLICKYSFRKILKFLVVISLYFSILELLLYIHIFGNSIQSVAATITTHIDQNVPRNISEGVQANSLLNQNNQRNVTIEIPTYESDVSEPQFQFNLISPSPNETWTIGSEVAISWKLSSVLPINSLIFSLEDGGGLSKKHLLTITSPHLIGKGTVMYIFNLSSSVLPSHNTTSTLFVSFEFAGNTIPASTNIININSEMEIIPTYADQQQVYKTTPSTISTTTDGNLNNNINNNSDNS
eukprot:jgi/Orpsp1_1/1185376/evm.model.c7180000093459.1